MAVEKFILFLTGTPLHKLKITSRSKLQTLTKQDWRLWRNQRIASQMPTIHIILLYAWEGNYWFPVFMKKTAQSFKDEESVSPRTGLQTEAVRKRLRTCCFSPWNTSADVQELVEQTLASKEARSLHCLKYNRLFTPVLFRDVKIC